MDRLAIQLKETGGVVPHRAGAAARATSSQSTERPVTQNLQWPQEGVKVSTTFSPIRDFGTPGPTGLDDAAGLVAEDHRLRMHPDVAEIMDVAAADRGGGDLHPHFHLMRVVDQHLAQSRHIARSRRVADRRRHGELGHRCRAPQTLTRPPSIGSTVPVMKEALSEARKAAASPISSGSA